MPNQVFEKNCMLKKHPRFPQYLILQAWEIRFLNSRLKTQKELAENPSALFVFRWNCQF